MMRRHMRPFGRVARRGLGETESEGQPPAAPSLPARSRSRKVWKIECARRPTGLQFPESMRGSIRSPAQTAEVFYHFKGLEGDLSESMSAIFLDSRHQPIGIREVARGSANVVHASPRDLFRDALASGAMALVMSHNHPTGDPTPSAEDLELTRRMRAAGDLVGVTVLDHIIVGSEGYYSTAVNQLFRTPLRRPSEPPPPPMVSIFGGALALALLVFGGAWLLAEPEMA